MGREHSGSTSWLSQVRRLRIIAAVRRFTDLEAVRESGLPVVFVLNCSFPELRAIASACRADGRLCFAHVDLIDGIAKDPAGVELLTREAGVDGLISTRSSLVHEARRNGLVAVQRVFLLDSGSLSTAISVAQQTRPDAVEMMPALVVPAIAHRIPFADLPPVIAGGLVQTPDELRRVLESPVVAVSTSARALWSCRF